MRSDAYITVTCDKCGNADNIELCACVRNSWDERYVDRSLKDGGWVVRDGQDICEMCKEEGA